MSDEVLPLVVRKLLTRCSSRRHLGLSQRLRVTIILEVGKHHGTLPKGRSSSIREHTLRSFACTSVGLSRTLGLRLLLLLFLGILQDGALTIHKALIELRVLR